MEHPIYPCLWFDNQARQAADFYCSVFKKSKIVSENPIVVIFELNGQQYMGLNGGPNFKFNEAVSFVIECDTQEEIDYYWNRFTTDGGQESRCGWCKDKFGVSWQVVPSVLKRLMNSPETAQKVTQAFMKMKKFDIAQLVDAASNSF